MHTFRVEAVEDKKRAGKKLKEERKKKKKQTEIEQNFFNYFRNTIKSSI